MEPAFVREEFFSGSTLKTKRSVIPVFPQVGDQYYYLIPSDGVDERCFINYDFWTSSCKYELLNKDPFGAFRTLEEAERVATDNFSNVVYTRSVRRMAKLEG